MTLTTTYNKEKKQNCVMTDFNSIIDEYRPDNSILSTETEHMNRLKNIVFNDLTEIERRLLIVYCETGSMFKTGTILNVSASSIHKKMTKIREKIVKKLNYDN